MKANVQNFKVIKYLISVIRYHYFNFISNLEKSDILNIGLSIKISSTKFSRSMRESIESSFQSSVEAQKLSLS